MRCSSASNSTASQSESDDDPSSADYRGKSHLTCYGHRVESLSDARDSIAWTLWIHDLEKYGDA